MPVVINHCGNYILAGRNHQRGAGLQVKLGSGCPGADKVSG